LGNLQGQSDWGLAREYVEAMWRMLQQPGPDDSVVATGETDCVCEFCEVAFAEVGLDYRDYAVVDENFYRPAEVNLLMGDAGKARTVVGWEPKLSFRELVREMVQEDTKYNDGSLLGCYSERSMRRIGV